MLFFPPSQMGHISEKKVNNIDTFVFISLYYFLSYHFLGFSWFRSWFSPIWIRWPVDLLDIAFVYLWMIILQGQRLAGYNGDHWKWRQVLSFVNDDFCSRCQRHVDSSTNHRLTSVSSPVQQWLCACVWLQWGELSEWMLSAAGRVQTAEWDTGGVWRIVCHRFVCHPDDSRKPLEWILNPKTMSCFSCYVLFIIIQINNSTIYWLGKPLILLYQACIIAILCLFTFQVISGIKINLP